MTDLARDLALLGERVRGEQNARLEADHSLGAERVRFLTAERRALPKLGIRRALLLAATLGVLGAALTAFAAVRFLKPAPLQVTAGADHHAVGVGDWIRSRSVAVPLNFSDGTSITLDPGSRARLEAVDAAGAHLTIETGHADVKVVPGRDGRWHLSLGPFGVDVTGTQFDIGWNPDAEELSLAMREGKVMVSGCVLGDGRPLAAGEELTASCRDRRFEVVRTKQPLADNTSPSEAATTQAPQQPSPARAEIPQASAPAFARTDPSALAPDSWQALARAGKYKAAFTAANSAGFDAEVARSSAEDLSLLGDIARFGGNVESSTKAYLSLRRRFPHTPLAANAAFAMGRMEFDQRGAFADAEHWFASYLSEQPRGPFAREALGRRMEALDRAGNADGARSVAASYQRSYPRGPHIHLAERLLGTP
jgi:hypothetical protein